MVIAEALTIHKSQGSTYENVVVHLPSRYERALVYVALSRATTLNGLYLIGKFKKTKPDPSSSESRENLDHQPSEQSRTLRNRSVQIQSINRRTKIYPNQEMTRLRNEAVLVPKFQGLRRIPNGCMQLVSHNVRSLKRHLNSIRKDTVFLASQFLLLQETWLRTNVSNNEISIPEKSVLVRNTFDGDTANGKGTIIYGSIQEQATMIAKYERIENKIDVTICQWKDVFIINMYQSSGATMLQISAALRKLNDHLHNPNVLVCGDFNENLFNDSCRTVNEFRKYQLKLLSPEQATTYEHTIIDGVFGRLRDYTSEVTVYESYFSDHKPLVVRLHPKIQSSGLSQTLRTLNF